MPEPIFTSPEGLDEFFDWKDDPDFPLARLLVVNCPTCSFQIAFDKDATEIECPNCHFTTPIKTTPRQSKVALDNPVEDG